MPFYRTFNKEYDLTCMPINEGGHIISIAPKLTNLRKAVKSCSCNIHIKGISNLHINNISNLHDVQFDRNALVKITSI